MGRDAVTINHVAMVVPSIEAFLAETEVLYGGFQRGPLITNDRQRVRETFLTDGKTVIELLEPMGEGSPLAGFLKKNRAGGLIHLALDVDDLAAAIAAIRDAGGVVVTEPTPDVAFPERRIAFVSLAGQLTELIERAK